MKIIVLDGATLNPGDNPWDPVAELGKLEIFPRTNPNELIGRSVDADVLVTNKVVIDESAMAQLPNLKFIAVTATGYNVVDVANAAKRNIPVSNVPIYGTRSVAQHVFASLLAFIHRPERHHLEILDGEWNRSNNFSYWNAPLFELAGKTMGIVGLGRIGMATAKLAQAFGMEVIAARRSESMSDHEKIEAAEPIARMPLESVFETADVISLHCPQTDSNIGFVNRNLINKMKPQALLVNTARGGLINEADLAAALNDGQIAGAILDVVSQEPINEDNPLLSARNCLLTPHLAWATLEARQRLMKTTAENIAAFASGSPINTV